MLGREGAIGPYLLHQATGHRLLAAPQRGQYATSDQYLSHVATRDVGGQVVLLATDHRLLLVLYSEVLATSSVGASYFKHILFFS